MEPRRKLMARYRRRHRRRDRPSVGRFATPSLGVATPNPRAAAAAAIIRLRGALRTRSTISPNSVKAPKSRSFWCNKPKSNRTKKNEINQAKPGESWPNPAKLGLKKSYPRNFSLPTQGQWRPFNAVITTNKTRYKFISVASMNPTIVENSVKLGKKPPHGKHAVPLGTIWFLPSFSEKNSKTR